MAKLFAIEEFEAPEVEDEASTYLDGTLDHELMEIVEEDDRTVSAQVDTTTAATTVVEDGITAVTALEKLAHMAKSALVGPNKGFTPGEAEAINFGLEAISTMIGASKPLLTLKTVDFATESLSTKHTTGLSMSQEGIMDAIKNVIIGIWNAIKRGGVAVGRFFKLGLPALFRVKKMAERLLKRAQEARDEGLTPTTSTVNSYNVAKVNWGFGQDTDILAKLAVRNDRLTAHMNIVDEQGIFDALINIASSEVDFAKYMNEEFIPRMGRTFSKDFDPKYRDEINDLVRQLDYVNPVIMVDEYPLNMTGERLALIFNRGFQADGQNIDPKHSSLNWIHNGIFSIHRIGATSVPSLSAETPVMDLDSIEAVLNAILLVNTKSVEAMQAHVEEVFEKISRLMMIGAMATEYTPEERAMFPVENPTIDFGKTLLGAAAAAATVIGNVSNSTNAEAAAVGLRMVAKNNPKFDPEEDLKFTRTRLINVVDRLAFEFYDYVLTVAVEANGTIIGDHRLLIRAAYDSLRTYGVIQEKLDIEADDKDLIVIV